VTCGDQERKQTHDPWEEVTIDKRILRNEDPLITLRNCIDYHRDTGAGRRPASTARHDYSLRYPGGGQSGEFVSDDGLELSVKVKERRQTRLILPTQQRSSQNPQPWVVLEADVFTIR